MIKFNCPHCNRSCTARNEQGGRRAPCPGCKKLLTIPALVGQAVDVEALAAATLGEEVAKPEPAKPVSVIEFNCPNCEEPIKISADLEGKQAPCPECHRIIKVPLRKKLDPKDWRNAHKELPSAARRDIGPAPEGEWGTATTAGVVSREALEEAEAIPDRRPPLTRAQKIKRISAGLAGVTVLGLVAWGVGSFVGHNRQTSLVNRAVAYVDQEKVKLPPESAAEIHRAAGEFFVRAGKAELAKSRFQKARSLLMTQNNPTESDFMLRDTALSIIDLGGDKAAVDSGARLKWDEASKELRHVMQNLRSTEIRSDALREVTRKLIARGQTALAVSLASVLGGGAQDGGETEGRVGLELLQAKQTELAEKVFHQQIDQFLVPNNAPAAALPKQPQLSASLIALGVALGKQDRIDKLIARPKVKEDREPDPAVRIGLAEGLARKGDLEGARRHARQPGSPAARLEASLAIVAAALDNNQPETARPDLDEAIALLEKERWEQPVTPWLAYRLIQLGIQLGMGDVVEKYARLLQDLGLRGRAQLELLRGRLAASSGKVDEALLQIVDKTTPTQVLGLEMVARHNARFAPGDMQKAVDGWEPETHRPFGYIGIALGLQDSSR